MQNHNESGIVLLAHSPAQTENGQQSRWTSRRTLVALIALAVVLRVLSALYQGSAVAPLPGVHDQVSYHGLAQRVLDGYGFSFGENHWPATRAGEPTAHWSYLYTLYLTGVYALFGVQPLAARLIQAVIAGILHTWLAERVGRRVFGPAAGMAAAALTAVYIYFVYYAGALITETFYFIGILWTFDAALRLDAKRQASREGAGWAAWAELGLAVGVTGLLRQLFLLVAPLFFLWLLWRQARSERAALLRTVAGLALAGVVVVAMIAPWTVRNMRAFGSFVPLNTNAGYAFYWGNHPIYGTKFRGILPANGPTYLDLIPPELLSLDEAALDRALLQRGIGFVVDDPGRYALLSLSRTAEYFKFWPSPSSGLLSNLARVASFGLLLPFMLAGLWLSATRWWRRNAAGYRAAVALLWLYMAAYTAIHLLTWTLIRYRLPVDTVLVLFAGAALAALAERLSARSRTPAEMSSRNTLPASR